MHRFFSLIFITSLLTAITSFAQPTFTKGSDVIVQQNSGVYLAAIWATDIVAVQPKFEVLINGFSGSITSFVNDPVLDAAGNLTFEIPMNVSGSIILTVILEDESTGEAVQAFIVKKDPKLTEQQVVEHCREKLTAYKIPKRIRFSRELPKTTVGKILRKDLRMVKHA